MSQSRRSKPTLSEVAALAGVSQATASMVLNNSEKLRTREQTRQKVQEAARALGYSPKAGRIQPVASGLRKIAYVVNDVGVGIAIDSVNGARETAWLNDYLLSVMSYGNDDRLLQAVLEEVRLGGYAGILFASRSTRTIIEPQLPTGLPVVFLNARCQEKSRWPAITPADLVGGYQVTQHLIEQGFRRIAHITGDLAMEASTLRLEGYRRALSSHDIPLDEQLIREGNWNPLNSYRETLDLMTLKQKPDAIFVAGDTMAPGVYQALKELGLKVPEEVAVAGYDNSRVSRQLEPLLTTFELPYYEMGQFAVETLLALLDGKEPSHRLIKYEGRLLVRESSQGLRAVSG